MTSLGKRLLLTFTVVPALFCIIYFLPYQHHLAFAILAVVVTAYGSKEIKNLIFKDGQQPLVPYWLTAVLPISQYVEISFIPSFPLTEIVLAMLLLIAFTIEIKRGESHEFAYSIPQISKTTFMIAYPGIFSIFLIKLLQVAHPTEHLLMLFILVFGNDVFAYVFGMLLGKNNRNMFHVSPNKSLAGFIGGTCSAILLSIAYISLVPAMNSLYTTFNAIIFGLVISISSSAGDLIESTIKRGSDKKDSGTIILGRGGLLDSIDSLLASAPFFLLLVILS